MSVQSHLVNLKNSLVLSDVENGNISRSINTLSTRIDAYFPSSINKHFKFGSSTRGTILPRNADEGSDIDYMVIFKNEDNFKPQTLLNHLRKFAEFYYRSSDIKQSHPTIVLELNHIKFELVPAISDFWGYISIPSPSSGFADWMNTDPNGFNKTLTDANIANSSLIKPMVRIMKYWNARNGHYLPSYNLEKWLAEKYYFDCHNLKDYVYTAFNDLAYEWNAPQGYKDKVDRAKRIIAKTQEYEAANMPVSAELAIRKVLPGL